MSLPDTIAAVAAAFAALGAVATFIAVIVAIRQLRDANKTAVSQAWLMLRGVMTQYDDIHANFRPLGQMARVVSATKRSG